MASVAKSPSFWLRHADRAVMSPVVGKLTGELPAWLRGSLYRNGAAIKEVGPDRYNHLFDGLACIHKFDIDGAAGKVTYQNRFLESDDYRANMAANRIERSAFGTLGRQDLCRSLFGRLMSTYKDMSGRRRAMSDNCSVNVAYFGSHLYAMTETNRIWRVSDEDLAAEKQVDLSKVVSVDTATAHPHVAPDGTVYNIGSFFASRPAVNFIEFPADGGPDGAVAERGRIVGSVPHRWPLEPSYFHSFGITDNYFVFVQQPLVIQVKKMVLLKLKRKPVTEAIAAKPEEGTWIRLVNRWTGEVHSTTFTADTFYTFHHVNAYEEYGNVVVDLCCSLRGEHSIMDIATVKYLSSDEEEGENPMLRFVLPLETQPDRPDGNLVTLPDTSATARRRPDGTVHCEPQRLSPAGYRSLDLPRINYAYNGRRYRFAYACRFVGAAGNAERLVKLDVTSGRSSSWSDARWSPSEPVFVPEPGAAAEDAGLLLASLLHAEDPRRAALVVLDAATMAERARAEFATDARLAKDFHGLFAADADAVHGY